MAKWRAQAISRLPELREVITSADTIMACWIELHLVFERAYEVEPPNESLIARIYSFADWCIQAPRSEDAGRDPLTAVTVAFFEHVPTHKLAREDMPRWFRYSEVAGSRAVFAYLIGDDEYDLLLKYMAKNQHRYQPRPSSGEGLT